MSRVLLGKLVLNIGVGRSGEPLEKAKKVLQQLTDQKISVRNARKTIRDFGTQRGEPVGLTVTLRGEKALQLFRRLVATRGMRLSKSSFDQWGNCSFGIREHIEISGIRYDPEVGIFGMNVSLAFERPGYRVARRLRASARVGKRQRVDVEGAIRYLSGLGVEVA